MLIAAIKNIVIARGVSFPTNGGRFLIRLRTSAGEIPTGLAGVTARAQYSDFEGSAVRYDLGCTFDESTATVELALTDEETAARALGEFRWDVLLVWPSGNVTGPYVRGSCEVVDVVTEGVS